MGEAAERLAGEAKEKEAKGKKKKKKKRRRWWREDGFRKIRNREEKSE